MGRKHKKTILQGEAHANATLKVDQALFIDSTGNKGDLSVDADRPQGRYAERSKVNVDKPAGIPHQLNKRQEAMDAPHGDAEWNSHRPAEHPLNNKRLRDDADDDDMDEISQTASKRSRLNESAGLNHVSQSQTTGIEEANFPINIGISASDPAHVAKDQVLPPEVRHLAGQYDFSTMSILSSAKIESRVRNLLERVQQFSFADTKAKPGIVILRAKADVANKLCSVVELAKQQIEKEKGKWWQYNKLHGELLEMKPKRIERPGGGKTLSEWSKVQAADRSTDSKAINETEEGSTTGQRGETADEEDDDMEESFEVMTDPKLRDWGAIRSQSGNGIKVRNTPVMTIIFAMVPVPGLKELYGEQTNV